MWAGSCAKHKSDSTGCVGRAAQVSSHCFHINASSMLFKSGGREQAGAECGHDLHVFNKGFQSGL